MKYKRNKGETCIVQGCTNQARVMDRCIYHYNIYRIYQRMALITIGVD